MIADAGPRAVRVAGAAQGVRVLEAPLDAEIGVELRDEERLRAGGVRRRPIGGAEGRHVAVGAQAAVVVLFLDDRVGTAVVVDGRGAVPAKPEGGEELAGGAELHQLPLGVVVPGIRSKEDAAVGSDGRRGPGGTEDAARAGLAGPAVTAVVRAHAPPPPPPVNPLHAAP